MQFNKKNIGIILGCIAFGVILWAILQNFSTVLSGIGWVLNLLTPFIIGGCMAFIINIPMTFFENHLFKPEKIEGKKFLQAIKTPVSMILAILLVLIIIALVLVLILPQLAAALETIAEKMPVYVESVKQWAAQIQASNLKIAQLMVSFSINLDTISNELINYIQSEGLNLLSSTVNVASSVVGTIVNIFIGVIFCIYCLVAKKTLCSQFRRILYAFNKEEAADKILRVLRMASDSFSGFITGQCTEAVIVAAIFSIVLSILKFPYAVMIGVTIGVLSIIPIVGSLIGCVIGALLIFLESPAQALGFIILFLVIQQIESNTIYPRVLGGKVGLPSMWVLTGVIIGGNAMGMLGMIITVPIFSVLYVLLGERVNLNLLKKKVPAEKLADPIKEKKEKKKRKEEVQETEQDV